MAATTRRADMGMPVRKAAMKRRRRQRYDIDVLQGEPPEEPSEMMKDDPDNVALECFEEGFFSDKEPAKLWGVK